MATTNPTGAGAPRNLSVVIASGDALDVRHFAAQERISELFSVSLTVVSEDPDIDFEAAVGQPARFEIRGGAGTARARVWTGVCSHLQQTVAEESGLSTYNLEIVPVLWLATQRRNYRMFQQMTEVDIALQLLSEWSVEPELALGAKYRKRKYRVQYGESDFTFLCRMLEDAGVSFYFSERDGDSRLVLSDAPQARTPREPRIAFRDHPTTADREHVTAACVARRVRPGSYTMRDHDYRRPPGYKLVGTAAVSGVERRLERYHYTPGAFLYESDGGDSTPHADDRGRYRTDEKEASALAQRRLEAQRSEATITTFESNALDLSPGMVMGISEHPRRELSGRKTLLLVASTVTGSATGEWKLSCEARGTETSYRPALTTPKPKATGVESATVVGPGAEEIHTDEFGRVRVHFHWDRESRMDDRSSCWIHVSQAWGGTAFGGMNLPRVGQEVIVDFLGGDPDRPVVTGRVYTNLEKVPYRLPENKTQSGWKSNSSPRAEGFNEIMFEDLADKEVVYEQAQKDRRRLVKRDEIITVGNDRQKLVKASEIETTNLDRTEVTGVNRTEITGAHRVIAVGGDRDQLVKGSEQEQTLGSLRRSVGGSADVVVSGALRESVGSLDVTVGGDERTLVGGSSSLTVKQSRSDKVVGDVSLEVGGNIHIKAGATLVIEVGSDFTIKGPGGFIRINADGLTMKGSVVKINSGGTAGAGHGVSPAHPVEATPASVAEPARPEMDDVSRSRLGQ